MPGVMTDLLQRIRGLEDELEAELARRAGELPRDLRRRGVRFEQDLLEAHRRLRMGLYRFLRTTPITTYLTAPVIYALIFPLGLLDLAMSVYQWICFPAYGIPRVRRGAFVALDRRELGYLNLIEKVNCVYCGYGNGVLAYAREVASRTEQYWCPIKHARSIAGAHRRYGGFLEYGDGEGYRTRLEELRTEVRKLEPEQGANAPAGPHPL
jgi:hypothetical protein